MLLVGGAIVAGILIGVALGGNLRHLADIKLRWWPLALIGLGLQLAPIPDIGGQADTWLAMTLLMISYVVLLVFVALNLRLAGFPLVAAGLALNFLVIAVNSGMPVSDRALRATYGEDYAGIRRELVEGGGAKHHLARSDDVLLALTDVIPVGAPIRLVLSVGDIVFYLGVVWVLAAATRGPPGRHRPGLAAGTGTAGRPAVTPGWRAAPDSSPGKTGRAEP